MRVDRLTGLNGKELDGPLLITPQVFGDDRGFFFESWNEQRFRDALVDAGTPFEEADAIRFRQDNHSSSCKGVLRGLHYQLPPEPQGKLVRCSLGAIFDVAVDLRAHSSTYGQWVSAELSSANQQQLWVPVGFAHGFLTLSDRAEVQYKVSGFWSRACERSLFWADPSLKVAWPLDRIGVSRPLLADKDAAAPGLAELASAGEVFG